MAELQYKPSTGAWPLAADYNGQALEFTGSLHLSSVAARRSTRIFAITIRSAALLLVLLGCLSLAYATYQALPAHRYWFLLEHNFLMLGVWIGLLAALYFWADMQHEQASRQEVNVTTIADTSNTEHDVYAAFDSAAKHCWDYSFHLARKRGADQPGVCDLFLSLLSHDTVQLLFLRLGVSATDIKTFVGNYLKINSNAQTNLPLDRIPFLAFTESLKLHNPVIDPLMLLCALSIDLPDGHIIQDVFFNIDLTLEKLEILASWGFNVRLLREQLRLFEKLAKYKPDDEINRGFTSVPTHFLDNFSQDLTMAAKYGQLPVALGRQNDLTEIFKLMNGGLQNLVIKGAEGTGRTTLVNELAYKMATEQVPAGLQDKRLVKLEISGIMGTPSKAEEVFSEVLTEAVRAGNIVVVIEDLTQLARAQTTEGLSLLDLLVNFLEQGTLLVIGTTTLEDYTDYLHPAANFDQIFTSYELQDLGRAGVLLASCIRASLLESQNHCFFDYHAIEQAVNLTDVYLKDTGQPQKAISVLVEAAHRMKNSADKGKPITTEVIQKIISDRTHIPAETFTETEAEKLLKLEEEIGKYVVGQRQAVEAVAEGLRRSRSGLASGNRPVASFLFLGPTGVGKTELAKTLARTYFGEEKFLLRLDMSEYRGEGGLNKLLGSAESETDTPLVQHLKNYPFCLLLCDEFEKASPEVLNLFLQILEDGRLTSGRGDTLDLTHAMIIATSNAGTLEIQAGIKAGKTLDQIKTELFNTVLTTKYPPELLNRFDGVILFSPLNQQEVQRIAYLQLQYLRQQMHDKGVKIEFSQSVLADIASNAFDPTLGARPIRRYIQDHVEGFLAKLLLSRRLTRGTSAVIDLVDGKLVMK